MILRIAVGLTALCSGTVAIAGTPYLTDDPAPTEPGRWEIYAFTAGEGGHSALDADAGLDLNYGVAKDVQLTATLPLSFAHEPHERWRNGPGDAELGLKYRFINDEKHGFSAAISPRAILPTSKLESQGRTRFLLPVWVAKDFTGGTSLFGGGGYEVNRGSGNRGFWQAAAAVTQVVSARMSVGAEITRQGPDSKDGTAQTRAGVGSTIMLSAHHGLFVSGGPT